MPRSFSSIGARVFSFPVMLTSLLVALVAMLVSGRNFFSDPDIWWHLRDAKLLLETHAFIHSETYSFTASGRPWINSEWLSEIPFYLAWRWFGPRGIFVLTVALIESVLLGVVALGWQRTRNVKAALLAGCAFPMLISVSIGPRTVMFGWLCLIGVLFLLRDFREGRDRLWLLPPLFALWINLHGTWPIGIVYLALLIAFGLAPASWGTSFGSITMERWSALQRGRLLHVAVLSCLALFINPYGIHLIAFPLHMLFGHRLMIDSVTEWQSLDFHTFRGKFTFILIAALLVASLLRRRTWRLNELAFACIAILGAFTYTRLLVLAGIVLCPLLASEVDIFDPFDPARDKPLLNFAVLAAIAGLLISHIPQQAELQHQIAASCPVAALNYLRSAYLEGRVLNDLSWGGFIEWNDPQTAVFIDSRSEIFDSAGTLADYLDADSIKRPFELLDQYRIRYVLFPRDARLVYILRRSPGWVVRYEDKTAVVLEHQLASH